MFQQIEPNLEELRNSILRRFREFKGEGKNVPSPQQAKSRAKCSKPHTCNIKIDCDAVASEQQVALARLACDYRGDLVLQKTLIIPGCYPSVAEASAIRWGNIVIESDSKNCILKMIDPNVKPLWLIE